MELQTQFQDLLTQAADAKDFAGSRLRMLWRTSSQSAKLLISIVFFFFFDDAGFSVFIAVNQNELFQWNFYHRINLAISTAAASGCSVTTDDPDVLQHCSGFVKSGRALGLPRSLAPGKLICLNLSTNYWKHPNWGQKNKICVFFLFKSSTVW